jgi:cytochrome c-type protein NapC
MGETVLLLGIVGISIGLILIVLFRPSVTMTRGGKILAFVSLFVFPILSGTMGASTHIERSKETQFCLSCHVMEPFGKSLSVDDTSYIPAAHFQNHRIPPAKACYTCHTDYTMYGDIHSKLRGLRHVYVQYFGKVPAPPDIKLYTPYNNRECLHCHEGARSFEENPVHNTEDTMKQLKSNETSCLTCHATIHDVGGLAQAKFWKGDDNGNQ